MKEVRMKEEKRLYRLQTDSTTATPPEVDGCVSVQLVALSPPCCPLLVAESVEPLTFCRLS